MTEWTWIDPRIVEALHDRQLAEHGGPAGLRDPGGLESGLARARNPSAYGEPDGAALAAAYAYGIARNHPFVDGNKRTAWILARLFLALNDMPLRYDKGEAVGIILSLAAGEVSEEELGAWFRERIVAVSGAGRGGKE